MSLLRSKTTKYIFLKHMKFNLGMQLEFFRRGEVFEEVENPYLASGSIAFYDEALGQKLVCPADTAARLTEAEAENLMRIASLENRYKAFKEGCRFETPLNPGREVFVTVNGREFSGVVKVVLPSVQYSEPMVEVEIQDKSIPTGTLIPSGQNVLRCLSNGKIVVVASYHKLRPRYESNRRTSTTMNHLTEDKNGTFYRHDQEFSVMVERTRIAERKTYEMARKLIASTQLALEEKEKDLAASEQISDEFEKELNIEQEVNKNLDLKLKAFERKLACEQKAKKHTEQSFQTSQERVQKLENTLAKERHAHEQTKEHLKKMSNEAKSTENILNELQMKIIDNQKAKEAAEKRLQCCQEKTKELENTLATAQKLFDRKQGPENVCAWILNREEINLTKETLGSGTFGTVFKGMFRGTEVAVKKVSVKPRITEYNIGNFRREMKMAARCRHPCMLQFIGATSDDQSPLLVTEVLDTSLKAVLMERALEYFEIETIAQDVAKGLNYLHLNRPHPIVHRDISSGNVLLWKHGQSWRGKISDYGNAVLMNYARTGSGGALSYLAPEMDNQRFSTKSDVYSYGVLLLEMCLRQEPSWCDNRDELICLVEDGRVRGLIRSCLRQDPKERPAMEEVLAVLTTASQLADTN